MAIKLKSILYNWQLKLLNYLIIYGSVALLLFGLYHLYVNRDFINNNSYYETNAFASSFVRISHNMLEKQFDFTDEEAIRQSDLSNIEKNEQIERLNTINNNINEGTSFFYVFYNKKTGEMYSNLSDSNPIERIKRMSAVLWDGLGVYNIGKDESESSFNNDYFCYSTSRYIINKLKDTNWQYYTAVTQPILTGDQFFGPDYKAFLYYKQSENYYFIFLSIAFILLLLSVIYLTIIAGKRSYDDKSHLLGYDKVPIEIMTIVNITLLAILLELFARNLKLLNIYIIVFVFGTFALLEYMSIVRLIKNGRLIKNSLIYRLFAFFNNIMQMAFFGKAYKPWITLLIFIYTLINIILVSLMWESGENRTFTMFFSLVVFNALVIYYVLKRLRDIKTIMDAVHERARGNIEYSMDTNDLSDSFKPFGNDINKLQDGLKIALEEAIKGEKLKTELITNVTHDLKNPLTSIINYIDLLNKEELDNEQAKNYLKVLDEKSKHLKVLIEQIVEASKASSGNVPVNIETIDLYQLMQQVLGEYDEALKKTGLIVILEEIEHPLYAYGDNKQLWRIFENLMTNVIKYAMQGTRVYISFELSEDYVAVFIKNISASQLNIPVNELTERFVRGDESRNTEGNGLGLSIAISLAKLMDAAIEISIDGDLFKAGVKLKKSTGIEAN